MCIDVRQTERFAGVLDVLGYGHTLPGLKRILFFPLHSRQQTSKPAVHRDNTNGYGLEISGFQVGSGIKRKAQTPKTMPFDCEEEQSKISI